ncbi:MAG: hypothetical protein LBT97_12030 [Planctomycetota bacterium]|jgi:hypothetical protein|nr:hypothetical protein [Planctomycetota bacterium]
MRMTPHYPDNGRLLAGLALLMLLLLAVSGCGEPLNVYKVSGQAVDPGSRVLVLPFMDARTFVDPRDPYQDNLGEHARDIFAAAMREHPLAGNCEIVAPEIARPEGSMTIAEVAAIGRRHGVDFVVSGQVFSFTGTRAASIPPRAGMFIRIVSARDGSLVFVGDHYQSAPIPGAPGGRELQARSVSDRLVEGFVAGVGADPMARRSTRSAKAMASINLPDTRTVAGAEHDLPPLPPFPPFPVVFNGEPDADAWAEMEAPAVPVVLDYDDFYSFENDGQALAMGAAASKPGPESADSGAGNELSAPGLMDDFAADAPIPPAPPPLYAEAMAEISGEKAAAGIIGAADESVPGNGEENHTASYAAEDVQPLAPPSLDGEGTAKPAAAAENGETPRIAETEADGESGIAAADLEGDAVAAEAGERIAEVSVPSADTAAPASPETTADGDRAAPEEAPAEVHVEYADSFALKSGDELAADLFEDEMRDAMSVVDSWRRAGSGNYASSGAEAEPAEAAMVSEPVAPTAAPENRRPGVREIAAIVTAVAGAALRPGLALRPPPPAAVVSDPIDSPTVEQPRPVHMIDMVAAAASAIQSPAEAGTGAANGGVKVLFLPYHDRENPNNLIRNTGGGEVVTALFGARLAMEKNIQVLWPEEWFAGHDRIPGIDEALQLGRMSGVDYVVRGQVVEFRRAQSVPSFYSAMISTAVLAAQIMFAEISGVDVATEVFRVSDGKCVLSRRDRSQQKYVVQAEKTVRKLAIGVASAVSGAVLDPPGQAMDPLIDDIQPVTIFGNPL